VTRSGRWQFLWPGRIQKKSYIGEWPTHCLAGELNGPVIRWRLKPREGESSKWVVGQESGSRLVLVQVEDNRPSVAEHSGPEVSKIRCTQPLKCARVASTYKGGSHYCPSWTRGNMSLISLGFDHRALHPSPSPPAMSEQRPVRSLSMPSAISNITVPFWTSTVQVQFVPE
jgi:hypothetical protein